MQIALSPEEQSQLAEQHGFRFRPETDSVVLYQGLTQLDQLVIGRNKVVIVEGTLAVDGPIIDYYVNNDDRSLLHVTGDVSARNMITGQSMEIRGDVNVRDLWYVVAWNDLNSIRIGGTATAGAFISIGAEPITARARRFGRIFDSLDPTATTDQIEDILLPGIVDPAPKRRKNLTRLHELVVANAPVLRSP